MGGLGLKGPKIEAKGQGAGVQFCTRAANPLPTS